MKNGERRKPRHARVVRMNISLPPGIVMAGQKILLDAGYSGWSDYFAAKIRRDAKMDPEDKAIAA